MSNSQASPKSRATTVLLSAIAALLAVDVSVRVMDSKSTETSEPVASSMPVAYQPEAGLANPLRQREQMIMELQSIDSRLASLESKLKGNIRVEVMNFPKVVAEKD
ncbi:MAG: hypothetical protein Phyf2KO_00120 [Phycisphaerales bacterium]